MIILGAGMAGCLAGIINPNAQIYEPSNGDKRHKALLRFRTPEISKVTGIPFKQVKVIKAIWDAVDGKEVAPSPRHLINYSQKVSNQINIRSIQNIDPCNRWIAPHDFHDRLIELCKNRIEYNVDLEIKIRANTNTIISTLPIFAIAPLLGWDIKANIQHNSIYTSTFPIDHCDVYMTIYYPSMCTPVYRASITGNKLIIESISPITKNELHEVDYSFGLPYQSEENGEWNQEQKNGKMVPMDNKERKQFITELTRRLNIYSLGRFATWRNILLDDVINDIYVIRQLINAGHHYDHTIQEINQ